MARQFFVGGNFKMNGSKEQVTSIVAALNEAKLNPNTQVVIAPPYPYLALAAELVKQPNVAVAAQSVSEKPSGAYTGEVSASQIKDVGAKWVLTGHSERRTIIKESSELIAQKTKFALDSGLSVILCIGETIDEKKAGETLNVCKKQLSPVITLVKDWSNVVIAYEPVWAIGTGLTPTPEDAQAVHADIRKYLVEELGEATAESIRILYGGSVNGKNASSFTGKDIDGFLVGGASLKPEFIDIINSRS